MSESTDPSVGQEVVDLPPLPPTRTGPWITSAVLCERVLQEIDGTLTLIRVIESVNIQLPPDGDRSAVTRLLNAFPELDQTPVASLSIVVSIRAPNSGSQHTFLMVSQLPDGSRQAGDPTLFEPPAQADADVINARIIHTVPIYRQSPAGTHRCDFYIDGTYAHSLEFELNRTWQGSS